MKFYYEPKREPVDVCGHQLFLQEMSAKQHEQWLKKYETDKSSALLVSVCLVDENGHQAASADEIAELPTSVVIDLTKQISQLHKWDDLDKYVKKN